MSKKDKKMLIVGVVALVAGLFFAKKRKKIATPVSSGATSGSGSKSFFEEMGLWIDAGATGKDKQEFLAQAIPGVTKEDLEAYWEGKKAGEVPNYTEQDKMLIEDVVVWA